MPNELVTLHNLPYDIPHMDEWLKRMVLKQVTLRCSTSRSLKPGNLLGKRVLTATGTPSPTNTGGGTITNISIGPETVLDIEKKAILSNLGADDDFADNFNVDCTAASAPSDTFALYHWTDTNNALESQAVSGDPGEFGGHAPLAGKYYFEVNRGGASFIVGDNFSLTFRWDNGKFDLIDESGTLGGGLQMPYAIFAEKDISSPDSDPEAEFEADTDYTVWAYVSGPIEIPESKLVYPEGLETNVKVWYKKLLQLRGITIVEGS